MEITDGGLHNDPRSPPSLLSFFLLSRYMKFSYVCRITLPFSDVNQFIDEWSNKIDKLLVYEHEADEEVSKTHCHFLILDSQVKNEQLKRISRDKFPDLKGNESWSWKQYDPEKGKSYISYMTKGSLTAKFIKNFSLQELDNSRLAWVERSLRNDKPQKVSKKHDDVTDLVQSYLKCNDINERYKYRGEILKSNYECTKDICADVRKHVMSHIYHKTGMAPFPGTYKQIAATVFLRVIEDKAPDQFSNALEVLKNIWY